ncbi:MAG TPA: hypothetical protein VFW22_02005 [Pseudolabrys sp.]|nr:hypothetical protein [Pseudolabrys sp.]
MRRTAVALLFVFGCLYAGSAQAEDLRFPKEGSPAFMISLPSGWTGHEDQYNGIQLLPADHRTLVYLSMVRDPQYTGKPLMDLALAIGKPSNISAFPKQEPAAISGHNGTAFLGQMKNDKGTLLDVKMVIIPLEPDLWATETLLTSQNLSGTQTDALNEAVRGVTLTGVK